MIETTATFYKPARQLSLWGDLIMTITRQTYIMLSDYAKGTRHERLTVATIKLTEST